MSNDSETFDDLFENNYVSRSEAQRLAREEVQKTLRDISTFNAQAVAGQQAAIHEVSSVHPDFTSQRDRMLATLQELPLLRDAISAAEANPSLAPTLPQLYEIVYRAAQASTAAATGPSSLETTERPSDLDEEAMYQGALASQRVDLSPENRKSLMSELERKGVLDVQF